MIHNNIVKVDQILEFYKEKEVFHFGKSGFGILVDSREKKVILLKIFQSY